MPRTSDGIAAVAPAPSGTAGPARPPRRERLYALLLYAVSLAVGLGEWQGAAYRFHLLLLFPPPTAAFGRLARLVLDGTLELAAAVSLLRILVGFLAGSLLGILLGLLLGAGRTWRAVLEPYVHFLRFVPPLAWFAPVLLWVGTGELAKVLLIVYTTVFVVALNTMAGVLAIPHNKLRMASAFGASRPQIFLLVVLPGSLPYVLTGMRIAMGNSFMTVVAAEMLAANQGLGYLIQNGVLFLDTNTVFSGIIALGALGFLSDRAFRWATGRFGSRFTPG